MDPNAVAETFRHIVANHYVDLEGRCHRRDFWYYVAAYFIGYVILLIVQWVFGTRLLTTLYALGLFLPGLGVSVRRLHDIDKSGWWILIIAIPGALMMLLMVLAFTLGSNLLAMFYAYLLPIISLVAMVLLIYWYAQPGTPGDNRYGPAPAPFMPDTPAQT